jgi:hypothetical protein
LVFGGAAVLGRVDGAGGGTSRRASSSRSGGCFSSSDSLSSKSPDNSSRTNLEIVDLDFRSPIAGGRAKRGANQVLLGNINPVTVLRGGTREDVFNAIAECHRQAGARYIVGAGCEIHRDTPPENVRALGDYARSHKPGERDEECACAV